MPILIERKFKEELPEIHYKFELNPEETKKFLNEFLKDFWNESKVPEDQDVNVTVSFVMDFIKKDSKTIAEKALGI